LNQNVEEPCLISNGYQSSVFTTSINAETRMQSSTQFKTPENNSDSLHFFNINFYPENDKQNSTDNNNHTHYYARQHICYSAYMLWQFRLSVRPSVRPSVTRVDQSKTVQARIT